MPRLIPALAIVTALAGCGAIQPNSATPGIPKNDPQPAVRPSNRNESPAPSLPPPAAIKP